MPDESRNLDQYAVVAVQADSTSRSLDQYAVVAVQADSTARSLDQHAFVVWKPNSPVVVCPDITGPPLIPATFDASASTNYDYITWAWTSVPGGSSIANAVIPYPDGTLIQGTEMPDGTAVTPVAMPNNQAAAPVDMTDNVLLMHMDGNADDDSGQGNNGTIVSATLVAGRIGSGAYQFNGTSDVITIPNTADLSMGAGVSWSVCAWVKPTLATTGYEGFLYHGAAGANQIVFGRDNNGYFTAGNGGSGTWQVSTSDQFLYSNVWYHLAAVVDRSANTITLYVNGRQVKTQAWTFVPSATTDDSTVGRGFGAAETFGGVLDELAVWRRALSASEIQGIYDLQKGWENLSTPADMEANEALYHLDGTVNDDSGAGRNLTLYNSPTFPTGYVGTNCIEFNGTNQYAEADIPSSLNGTIACWVQITGTLTNGDIFVGFGPTSVAGVGKWRAFSYYNGGFSFFGYNADIHNWYSNPVVGQWYHVVITWDSANLVSCYLNGVLITSQTIATLESPSSVLSLGARTAGATYYASCKLDEVAVWSRAISAAEVASLYALQEASATNPTTPIDMTNNQALYHLESTGGDDSGNARDLTLFNTPTFPAGKVGTNCIEFNGTNQYAQAGVPVGTTGTIACWVQITSTPQDVDIFVGFGPTELTGTGKWRAFGWHSGGFSFFGYAADIHNWYPSPVVGQWYHVVITWDATNLVSCYLDGALITSQTIAALTTPSQILSLGARTISYSRYAPCKLDEVAIWSRALSKSEIGQIYAAQNAPVAGVGDTLTFTPDVVGSYTVDVTTVSVYGSETISADALITSPSDGGIYAFQGYSLLSLDPTGVYPILQGDFKDK